MRITGRILALQEQRFRLATDDGQVVLLTLAAEARADAATLADWQRRGTHLEVQVSGEPNVAGGVARLVQQVGRR
jgi:hypothetical protein